MELKFSFIIVTWNRCSLLKECLESLIKEAKGLHYELIIILNGHDKLTLKYLQDLSKDGLTYIPIKKTSPAQARNIGIDHSSGDYMAFFDDDLIFPQGYFKIALDTLKNNPKTLVMGGPDRKGPWAKGTERNFNYALESPFTSGPTLFRHISKEKEIYPGNENNLILCNFWVHRKIFKVHKVKFDPSYFRNEETDFIKRIKGLGGDILHVSEMFVFHKRKKDIFNISRTYFISGFHRARLFLKNPNLRDLIFLLPISIILSLFAFPFLIFKLFILHFSFSLIWFLRIQNGLKDILNFPQIYIIQLFILSSYAFGMLYFPINLIISAPRFLQKIKA